MEKLLTMLVLIPLIGFMAIQLLPAKNERSIAGVLSLTSLGSFVIGLFLIYIWWISGAHEINIKEITLFESENYKFFIDLYFDQITATYLMMSALLTSMIAHFSRAYMHKDAGYKRFFSTLQLYYFGIHVIIFSGNFETLFIGWEILGVSSFLLIAYYRDRYLPVRNAFKVFSIYRIADISVLLTMWSLHHLYHSNITFIQLSDYGNKDGLAHEGSILAVFIALFIVVAAMVKSAQFPFSSWLPRAMEGPTPSSSIFYGSIAAHIGVFLLLRTYPFWSEVDYAKIVVVIIGAGSAIISSVIAQVQFSIKAQIAYSSLTQIGIMFIEVALGWHSLVLLHLCGNAFLRSYQLLNSPSVATYLLRFQFFGVKMNRVTSIKHPRIRSTLYTLSLNEFGMDNMIYKYLWFPFKRLGHRMRFLNPRYDIYFTILLLFLALIFFWTKAYVRFEGHLFLPELYATIAFAFVLRAFTIRKHPFEAWSLLTFNHIWIALSVALNESFGLSEIVYYLLGVLLASGLGFLTLYKLKKEDYFNLDDYYGLVHRHKSSGVVFLLCSLALMGFPISTSFIGEDLMFSHIRTDQPYLMALTSINMAVAGIAIMRIYARIYLGPSHLWSSASARRSS